MPPKKELCRNFSQRGSCRYGDHCRFLHAAQTNSSSSPFGGYQSQNSNPFGFGNQNGKQPQQTNQNSFGFGVQNNSQPQGGFAANASKQNQTKPFQNTWVRDQPNSGGQTNHQSAQTNAGGQHKAQPPQHKCTDAESCKRMIAEDFQNERPVWKLSCYSHLRDGPCEIVGDISSEELRAAAYDDVRRGLSVQAIVERERNLVNSKLQEYNEYVNKYNKLPVNSAFGVQSPFNNAQHTPGGTNNPPTLSSFSQFATTVNPGSSAPAPPTSLFGQLNQPQNGSQPSSTFPSQPLGAFPSQLSSVFPAQQSSAFTPSPTFPSQQPNAFAPSSTFPSQQPNAFAPSTTFPSQQPNAFAPSSTFASQQPNAFAPSAPGSVATSAPFQGFGPTAFVNSTPTPQQNSPFPPAKTFGFATNPVNGSQVLNLNMPPEDENVDQDDSVWLQATWEIGKIPESVPPARYC